MPLALLRVLAVLVVHAAALPWAVAQNDRMRPSSRPFSDCGPLPLALWTSAEFPAGLPIGAASGIACVDFDGDGWVDLFACSSANLWQNLQGQGWCLAANLVQSAVLPPATLRYGSAAADFDGDGRPDLATEPRNDPLDSCFHLLHNTGASPWFVDVAPDPVVLVTGQPCGLNSETACWGDVNGDGFVDLFLPAYPPPNGPGNQFFRSLGPAGPAREFQFVEERTAAGLDNPSGTPRPEGAQLVDLDGDGDLDLYSNGTVYQNRSSGGAVVFQAIGGATVGIDRAQDIDEGAVFLDYDRDADLDLLVAHALIPLVVLYENAGDGTFFPAEPGIVPFPGLFSDLGLSVADWDNDGDLDFTNRFVFRENLLADTGMRQFCLVLGTPPVEELFFAVPSWFDWDRDGDLDAAIGNWSAEGVFYENTLYDATTPAELRRFVRVRPVRDAATVPAGVESEFGAVVEVRVPGEEDGPRRASFTTSSAGYLQQSEYTLHFALPPDPFPLDPTRDVVFALTVDFPGAAADGLRRVDEFTNPILGSLNLANLQEREITVFRSGLVEIDGTLHPPEASAVPVLGTAAGGLGLAGPDLPLPPPAAAPDVEWMVGVELDTTAAPLDLQVAEVVLDGTLDVPVDCGSGPWNLGLLDVTDPFQPVLAHTVLRTGSFRNQRSRYPVNWLLAAGRRYRVVARVRSERHTPIAGPVDEGLLVVPGGFALREDAPCTAAAVAAVPADPTFVPLTVRYRPANVGTWTDLGHGKPGEQGIPVLTGTGTLRGNEPVTLALRQARPHAVVFFVSGVMRVDLPALDGVLVPSPDLILTVASDAAGEFQFTAPWPPGVAPGMSLYHQAWVRDPAATLAISASNGLQATTPD